ncbi:LLM class flavin-dependent oxidoreductase [Streptomyces bambusae]|uniref:LLM class flavin-dependent oxidoreductase n=1 Tax=Streptomyces bambusae TaxID=1550616 RepID=UPI001CFF97C1|nr:LLM class flavin-dependent oxidoreductase [Streptomyces bambusae]MCB5170210.1 LLM class flavin-dependent oxidoreductase [Streptomyces bambusae]
MRFGIVTTARPRLEDLAARAEELGYTSFWVYDTPMLHGDPFVSLALCAKATTRIRLGIGVTSPALRSAPAAAAALATLNALAPGRIICGVGTGNTARRTLGMPPLKTAELQSFTAALQDLTAGRETDYREGTRTSSVRFLHTEGHVNTEDPVEFAIAAIGPKAAAVAGRLGTGLISFALHAPEAWSALTRAHRAAATTDQATPSYLMTSLHVLADGEDRYGNAAKDATGHIALTALILAAENPSFRAMLPPQESAAVTHLLHLRGTTPLHHNYLGPLPTEDRPLVLPSLLDKFALITPRSGLPHLLTTLEDAGVTDLLLHPAHPEPGMTTLARHLLP